MANVLKKIQVGLESTKGTPVAATAILLGEHPTIPTDRRPQRVVEDTPYRGEAIRHRTDTILVSDSLRFPNAYYQLIPWLFSVGLKGNVTPAEQTPAQSDYLWDHSPSETASNSPDSLTLELGDELQAYEIEYVQIERIRISGNIPQDGGVAPVSIEVDYYGRQVTPTTFTGALSVPANERINAKLARAYIDTSWAGVGGTELAGLRRFEIEIMTGLHPDSSGSADKTFTSGEEGRLGAMMTLFFKRSSSTDTLFDNFQTGDQLKVGRLEITGSQIGTGETHTLTIDVGGELSEVIPLSEDDRGTGLDAVMIESHVDPTGQKQVQASVITNVASL